MTFVETPIFTKAIDALLDGDAYRALQLAVVERPNLGSLIRGGSGLRKMRWPRPGTGKRAGLRIIYFWDEAQETFYMLHAYPKSERDDLSPSQLKALARLVKEEFS